MFHVMAAQMSTLDRPLLKVGFKYRDFMTVLNRLDT
jgi:hypothetical protein